jgi:hypothetical protein
MTSLSATGAPLRALLISAASINAMISNVSSGCTGGIFVLKNLTTAETPP